MHLPDRHPRHPLGSQARVLLTSVFGPYARDDEYGSRVVNPMELYHNQVTRLQGAFSPRVFHRSWGLMFIQANLEAPCTVLDFPTLERVDQELRAVPYDIVGISSITVNLEKVVTMCRMVRARQPHAAIVVGGHISGIVDLDSRIDADHIVAGEGVRWFQEYLAQPADRPFRHPLINARLGARALGQPLPESPRDVMATLIPSVGCPTGCNFCRTSAMFGGRGRSFSFYPGAPELFAIMQGLEREMGASSFFVMDENFLLDRDRAVHLLRLMEQHDRSWALYVFSSANAVSRYTVDELIRLGIAWIWVGIEGQRSGYPKLAGIDTVALVRELRSHGIRVLGSSIIGLEHHTPQNMAEVIEWAVGHETDFHQFMLYMALPGTPLEEQMTRDGRMLDEAEAPHFDRHGQYRLNYRHPHIPPGEETRFLLEAFRRDFDRNGPSMLREAQTALNGWRRYRDHPDSRIRRRIEREVRSLMPLSAAMTAAASRYYRDAATRDRLARVMSDLVEMFGRPAELAAARGPALHQSILDEERRLAEGWTYEPPTCYEGNQAAVALPHHGAGPSRARWVEA